MDSPVVANVFGTISAVCWSIQLLPQILLNYRRHNATGLQPTMMIFWAWAGVPLGVYNIVSDFNIALQVQAQILTALSLITWAQVYYYEHEWPKRNCLLVSSTIGTAMAGIEYGLIHALRASRSRGTTWPVKLMAVLAALFLALGVLRHYWDIYTHRTVRGISFLFCFLDALGDLTAVVSVLFQPEIDVLGIVIYGVELALWIGIFAAGGWFNLRSWLKARSTRMECAVGGGAMPEALGMHHASESSTSAFRTAAAEDGATVQRRTLPLTVRDA